MPLTDKDIEQRVKALTYSGFKSGVACMGASTITWGDEDEIIDLSVQALIRMIDKVESLFPSLAEELKKVDTQYTEEQM
jgi:hypothetical protein